MTSPLQKKGPYTVRAFDIIGLSFNYIISLIVAFTRKGVLTAAIPQIKSTNVASHRAGGVAKLTLQCQVTLKN